MQTLKSRPTPAESGGSSLSASRFCPNCGKPVPAGNNFCVSCGSAIAPLTGGAPPAPLGAPGGAPPPGPPPVYAYAAPPPGAPPGYWPGVRRATFSEIISGTFDVWTKNFGPFFVVYLVLSLVTGGLSLAGAYLILGVPFVSGNFITGSLPTTASLAAFFAYEVVVAVITWILTSVVLGGVTDFAVRRHRQENVRIMDSLSRGLHRLLSILGANLLVTIITLGILILWAGLLVLGVFSLIATGGTAAGIAILCGGLIALPFVLFFVLYVDIALCLYAPVIMMEGSHAVPSLGRSWGLTKGHKWSIFAAGLILGIILVIIDFAFGAVGGFTGNPFVQLVATALASAITGSWFAILTAVAYELIRREPQPTVWPPTYAPPAYPPR